jgi:hypothetical protein
MVSGSDTAEFTDSPPTIRAMNDSDGPQIAADVYRTMFSDVSDGPNVDRSATAFGLDLAVRKLRETGVSASRWATYVHIGI